MTLAQGESSPAAQHRLIIPQRPHSHGDRQPEACIAPGDYLPLLPEEWKSPLHGAFLSHIVIILARICKLAYRSSEVVLKTRTVAI